MGVRYRTAVQLAIISCTLASAAPAIAGEPVRVRAAEHDGYGRIVFDWNTAVPYRVETSEARLRVRFERPLSTSFAEVERRLRAYVERIALSPDETIVEIEMTSAHRVRAFTNESSVVVDILRVGAGQPAKATSQTLEVRTGRHKQYGRFVFDWGEKVGYTVARSSDTVTVQFNRSARVDMPRLWRILPPQVSAVSAENTSGGLKVELAVPENQRIRHFRDGGSVVVDVLALGLEPHGDASAEPQTPRRGEAPAKSSERRSAAAPKHADPLPMVPTSAQTGDHASTAPEGAPNRGKSPQSDVAGRLVSVDVTPSESGMSVRFNWRSDVAAAVFRRQRTTWVVFDAPARLDLGAIRVLGRSVIEHAEQAPASGIAALALRGLSVAPVRMRRDGSTWILDLARASEAPPQRKTEAIRVESDSQGLSRLVIAARSSRGPYAFRDPEVGDMLSVVTTFEPGAGAAGPRQYVDVEVLASLQGIALRPNSETVEVRSERGSVVITGSPGLRISSAKAAAPSRVARVSARPLVGMREWRSPSDDSFEQQRARLFAAVVNANSRDRTRMRADLARFYLFHGMSADALGVADLIATTAPAFDLDMRALRGAANYLLGHYADATADFDHPDLKDEPGVLPWRAALAAARGDWKEAFELSRGSDSILAGYPNWLALRLGSMLTEAALTVDELEVAKKRLGALRPLATTPEDEHQVAVLQGYLLKKAGMVDQALAVWRSVSESENRYARARASFAETTTLHEAKRIDGKVAAEKLERLNFAWRGDAFEFDVLRQLGEIYVQNGEPREALSKFRLAATYFDNVKGTQIVAARMSEVYRSLYLGGGAEKLPPVTALAMFDEYRELLPSGRDGEEMVRRLADRLVRVDLLGDAAALLESQIEVNLSGIEKARVGARLAAIRLLDRKPIPALSALNATDSADAPADLVRDRKLLQARAYADLGKVREALAVIEGDARPTADDLRLAIFWRAAMWRDVMAFYAARYKGADSAGLDDAGATDVFRWSIAASLAGDTVATESLRSRFGERMAKTKHAEAFRAVVGSALTTPIDYRTLAKQAGDVDAFESFLVKYRERPGAPLVGQAG
jgi:tetratricopeptide (TPR) repeat protein